MRSLLALSFVALLAPLHASSSSVEDSELNALSARLRARNLQVDRLQRVSPSAFALGVNATASPCSVWVPVSVITPLATFTPLT